jgi:hypothetical protein
MGQRSVIKFRVKLRKKATETFGMLRNEYGENVYLEKNVFEWNTKFKELLIQ